MRVILAGQKSFGKAVYEMLQKERHDIAAVWSPPAPVGRDKLTQAVLYGDRMVGYDSDLSVWAHPDERTPKRVAELDVDLFVCAHSHDFISRQAREATRLGGIGYHPSLLPRHRGRDAVEWTIRMNDPVAGGSVYWLTDNVDGGPIALAQHVHVPWGWDAKKLWRKELFPLGVEMLRVVLRTLELGVIVEVPQNEKCATWEPSIGRPPLHRPDLVQLGDGVPGFEHIVDRVGASERTRGVV